MRSAHGTERPTFQANSRGIATVRVQPEFSIVPKVVAKGRA